MSFDSKTMKHYYDICRDYVHQHNIQERIVIGFIFLVTIYVLWFLFLQVPLKRSKMKLLNQQKIVLNSIHIKQAQLRGLVQKTGGKSALLTYKVLQTQEEKLNKQIHIYTQHLVDIKRVTALLRSVFTETPGLKLISFKNLPDKLLLTLPSSEKQNTKTQNTKTVLYEQGVELVFKGDFIKTLKYLQTLEKSSWPIFWDHLSYTVTKYPMAKVRIRVHTLSQQKED